MSDVYFDDAWDLGDYVKWAKQNPGEVVVREPLWGWWKPLRTYIIFFDFPWRLSSEQELVRLGDEDKEKRLMRVL